MITKTFSIRLTPDEIARLRIAAGAHRPAAFARESVLAAIGCRRPTRRQRGRDDMARALAEVQIAIMALVDGLDLGQGVGLEGAERRRTGEADTAALRTEIRNLTGAVLGLGRRFDGAEEA